MRLMNADTIDILSLVYSNISADVIILEITDTAFLFYITSLSLLYSIIKASICFAIFFMCFVFSTQNARELA